MCARLCICLLVGWLLTNLTAKPIMLTDEEVRYYRDTAETLWYEGFSSVEPDSSITFNIQHADKKVQILPIDHNKQSVTVDFSDSENNYTVNKPITNYWGSFFSCSVLCLGTSFILEGSVMNIISKKSVDNSP